MSIYSSPPAPRAFSHDKPTLLVAWWCTCFAATILFIRVAGRYLRTEQLFREDWIAAATLIPLFTRMSLVHLVLLYGTNNVLTDSLTPVDIRRREIGSKAVLASRIFYAATLWMLKLTISEFFKRLTIQIWRQSYQRTLQGIRWFLLISFIVVVIVDLAECRPIQLNWQVVPDPGANCRQGSIQLITMGTANVVTDLLLVLFPVPIILRSQMRTKKKVQLVILFAGSLLPAGITLFRIPRILDKHADQQFRSLMASVEILFATAVANGLILGSFARDRGLKKKRFKFGSVSDTMDTSTRRGTVSQHWGSDEDLVRDLGLGVNPELRGVHPQAQEKTELVTGSGSMATTLSGTALPPPTLESKKSSGTAVDMIPAVSPSRKVTFFDVGGLLGDANTSNADPTQSREDQNRSKLGTKRNLTAKSSKTGALQDIGGHLGKPTKLPRTTLERRYEMCNAIQDHRPAGSKRQPVHMARHMSLQDVGGLLK